MRILRSVTRRGYTVGQAGMFTITSPNRWFAASQFPDSLGAHAKLTPAPGADSPRTGIQQIATQPFTIPSAHDCHPMRLVWSAMAAVAVTLLLLWWFFHIAVRSPI